MSVYVLSLTVLYCRSRAVQFTHNRKFRCVCVVCVCVCVHACVCVCMCVCVWWGPGSSWGKLCMSHLMVEVPVGPRVPTPSSMRHLQPSCRPLVLSPGGFALHQLRSACLQALLCVYVYACMHMCLCTQVCMNRCVI